jgi:hypothetical protein
MVEVFEVGVKQKVSFGHRGTKGRGRRHFVQERIAMVVLTLN